MNGRKMACNENCECEKNFKPKLIWTSKLFLLLKNLTGILLFYFYNNHITYKYFKSNNIKAQPQALMEFQKVNFSIHFPVYIYNVQMRLF